MTDQEINAAIAEACGIKITGIEDGVAYMHRPYDHFKGGLQASNKPIPNYCNDLNAMHEAIKTLSYPDLITWHTNNRDVAFKSKTSPDLTTARQRAESFLKTIGKWKNRKAAE